jgi:transcriptional regulator with XRE-family HTH domain
VTDYSFGARLRRERERRGIALASIADRTKIAPTLLASLERGDVSRWPGGIYRRSFIRAYAEAVGLDPDEIAREFFEIFPGPVDPAAANAIASDSAQPVSPVPATARVRLRIDPAPDFSRGGPLLPHLRPRVGAVAVDLGVLGLVAAGFSTMGGAIWMPLALTTLCYYAGGMLILGNAPGVCLFATLADGGAASDSAGAAHRSAGARSATSSP